MPHKNPHIQNNLKRVDVVILCGGKGERLRSVISDRPKVLAPMGDNKVFLDIIIENLLSKGFKRIILSVGYLKDQIINRYENYQNAEILFVEEEMLLGTGGAVKNARALISSDHFLVLNGDSFLDADFSGLHNMHVSQNLLLSMVLTEMENIFDYGSVELDKEGKILNFSEKQSKKGKGLVNAGIYCMSKDIFNHMPEGNEFSLEYDLFPKISRMPCYGFVAKEKFIDIGTPERYKRAIQLLKNFKT